MRQRGRTIRAQHRGPPGQRMAVARSSLAPRAGRAHRARSQTRRPTARPRTAARWLRSERGPAQRRVSRPALRRMRCGTCSPFYHTGVGQRGAVPQSALGQTVRLKGTRRTRAAVPNNPAPNRRSGRNSHSQRRLGSVRGRAGFFTRDLPKTNSPGVVRCKYPRRTWSSTQRAT